MAAAPFKETTGRWLWLAPLLGLALAVSAFMFWGLSFWSAVLAALLLVCPALIVWGVVKLSRKDASLK